MNIINILFIDLDEKKEQDRIARLIRSFVLVVMDEYSVMYPKLYALEQNNFELFKTSFKLQLIETQEIGGQKVYTAMIMEDWRQLALKLSAIPKNHVQILLQQTVQKNRHRLIKVGAFFINDQSPRRNLGAVSIMRATPAYTL